MADWNKDRPDGGEDWNLADNRIRANFEYLELALQALSTFAINPANPTDRAVIKLSRGTLAARPVTTLASQTGTVYIVDDPGDLNNDGRMFINLNGAANTWADFPRRTGGNFIITGTLGVGGVATFNVESVFAGILHANAGLAIEGGSGDLVLGQDRRLLPPNAPAQNWLVEGADGMRPHLHGAARHRLTGANGAWVSALDAIANLINDIQAARHGDAAIAGAGWTTRASISRDFTARAGTSKVLAIGSVNIQRNNNARESLLARLVVDGNPGAIGMEAFIGTHGDDDDSFANGAIFELFTGVSAGAHTFDVQTKTNPGKNSPVYLNSHLLFLDLGDG